MTEASASPLSRREAWAIALTATLTMSVSYFDRQALAAIAPTVCLALDISETQYGLLASAFAVAYLVGAPLSGRLVDALGARRSLLGAVVVWSIVAAAHALVPSYAALFAMRIALGLAESPSFPGAAQTVHRALPPDERARGLGVLFSGSSLGAMLAPPFATFLAHRLGYQFAFVGVALVGLAWVPLWLKVTSTARARLVLDTPPKPEVEVVARGYRDTAKVEKQPSALALVVNPAIVRATLVIFASAPVLALLFIWSSKFLVRDMGLTQLQTGRYLWLPPILFDVGAILFGHLASERRTRGDKTPPNLLVGVASVLSAASALIPFGGGAMGAIGWACVAMVGGGGLYALTTADLLPRVPASLISTAGGICAAAQSIAQIIINPIIGYSVKQTGHYTVIFVVLGLWSIPGCVGWILWRPPQSSETS